MTITITHLLRNRADQSCRPEGLAPRRNRGWPRRAFRAWRGKIYGI